MTKTFIEEQQELAKSKLSEYVGYDGWVPFKAVSEDDLDTLVTQIITNTGKEMLRIVEVEKKCCPYLPDSLANDNANKTLDTMKQHITNLTGVE